MITFLNLGKHGDIGNQLFQYSTLISLAKDFNYEVKIPKLNNYFNESYGRTVYYITEGFNIQTNFLNSEDVQSIKYYYNESNFSFIPISNLLDNTSIHGYFQSEKYFAHNREYILQNLIFTEEIINYCNKNYDINFIKNSCFLHVRRGDFVYKSDYHNNLNLDYYLRALEYINPEFISIFSDDIEWCKNEFSFLDPNKVRFISNTIPFIDLFLMSQTKNCIIANSSFSWWGAWLNQNQNKIVIAPQKWFGLSNAHWSSNDIYCQNWIIL
jgi:hypothetical protein